MCLLSVAGWGVLGMMVCMFPSHAFTITWFAHTFGLYRRVLFRQRIRRGSNVVIMGRSPLLIVIGSPAQIVTDNMTCRIVIAKRSLRSILCYQVLVHMTGAIW